MDKPTGESFEEKMARQKKGLARGEGILAEERKLLAEGREALVTISQEIKGKEEKSRWKL